MNTYWHALSTSHLHRLIKLVFTFKNFHFRLSKTAPKAQCPFFLRCPTAVNARVSPVLGFSVNAPYRAAIAGSIQIKMYTSRHTQERLMSIWAILPAQDARARRCKAHSAGTHWLTVVNIAGNILTNRPTTRAQTVSLGHVDAEARH